MRPFALLVALAQASTSSVAAQDPDPFSWIRFGVGAAHLRPNLPPGDFWRPKYGAALRFETPLRPGTLAAGVHVHSASAGADVTTPDVDRLRLWLVYIGWGGERRMGPVLVGAEARLGTAISSVPSGTWDSERELLLGGGGWARVPLGAGWSVRGEVAGAKVYARHAWDPTTLSLGVARTMSVSPGLAAAGSSPGPTESPDAGPNVSAEWVAWWMSFPDIPARMFGRGVGTDRVDYVWSPGRLREPEAGAPRYWLDGIPLRDATVGGPSWAWLPLGAQDISRVSMLDRPGLLGGRVELEGAFAATTAPLPPDRRARVRGLILNESGDPGPLRFTGLTSPNVDAPLYETDAAAGHSWGGGWLTVSAAFRERYSVTRSEVRERNPSFVRRFARVHTDGASLGGGQRLGAVSVRVRAWATAGDRYLRGPALGRELAADVRYLGGGLALALPATSTDSIRAYIAHSDWQTDSPNRTNPANDARRLDWDESDLEAGLQYRSQVGETALTFGADTDRARDALDGLERVGWVTVGYVSLTRAAGLWSVEGGAQLGGGGEGSGAILRVERRMSGDAWLAAEVSERSGGRPGAFELWDRGVEDPALFSALAVATSGLDRSDRGRRTTARLETGLERYGWNGKLALLVHQYRRAQRPAVRYEWKDGVVVGAFGPLESGAGDVLGVSAELSGTVGSRVGVRISADAIRPSGSGAFEDWWSGAPRLISITETRLVLRPGWYVHTLLRAQTAVRWAGFELVTPMGAMPGGGALPGGVVADLRLEGVVLGGRFRLVAGVSNVLDHDDRAHPLGAGEARGLVLGLASSF